MPILHDSSWLTQHVGPVLQLLTTCVHHPAQQHSTNQLAVRGPLTSGTLTYGQEQTACREVVARCADVKCFVVKWLGRVAFYVRFLHFEHVVALGECHFDIGV